MPSETQLHVLIVEDDADVCDNLRDILELDDHRVSDVQLAGEALRLPDLESVGVVLLDWKLPDSTAMQLLPKLRSAIPAADVIIVTGHGDLDSAVVALREGAIDYLLKPINPEALRVSLRRIAERQWLGREKARSERAFRELVDASPCATVILRADETIEYFSLYAERMTGYFASEVRGANLVELLVPAEFHKEFRNELRQDLEGNLFRGFRGSIRRRDGEIRRLVWNSRFVDNYDGRPGILVVGQDVTDYEQAMEKLVQSERLAAIGEAITGLAHESRNALQRSQACLEMLSRRVSDRPEARELLERVQLAQDDLHRLYEEVRQYAAPIKLVPSNTNLADVVADAWTQLEHLREGRTASLELRDEAKPLLLQLDRFTMRQVFRNILENSLAACDDPVRIVVDIATVGTAGSRWVRVSIRDNGPGFSDEEKAKLFQPFFTTKTQGTGLGMTISRRIVETHGGEILVGDEPGPGAEIVLKLPI